MARRRKQLVVFNVITTNKRIIDSLVRFSDLKHSCFWEFVILLLF